MGQVAGGRRGVWKRRKVWGGFGSVDLRGGAFPPVRLEGGVPTAVQGEAEASDLLGRTHKACLLDISGHCSTQMIRLTCWTSPRSQTAAKLHPPLVMSHPAQLLDTAGPPHSPSGALRAQVLEWRVQHKHIAPHPGLHTAMAAWPKRHPPLLPILNPPLHLSHTLLAPPILPLMDTTPLATPPLLPQCHRDPRTAALHLCLDTAVARPPMLVILATRQQLRGAFVDILQQVIPPWCGGSQRDPRHLEEGTCLWPEVAHLAPPQKDTNSTAPISGATGKSLVAAKKLLKQINQNVTWCKRVLNENVIN